MNTIYIILMIVTILLLLLYAYIAYETLIQPIFKRKIKNYFIMIPTLGVSIMMVAYTLGEVRDLKKPSPIKHKIYYYNDKTVVVDSIRVQYHIIDDNWYNINEFNK